MKRRKVLFRPAAEEDLIELYLHIAKASGSSEIAFGYVDRLKAKCLSLSDFSERGAPRDDILPGLRILTFEGRTVIVYRVEGDMVVVTNLFHAGRDWEALLLKDEQRRR